MLFVASAFSIAALTRLVTGLPWGVDLVIPLRAASRWLSGEQVYLEEAFAYGAGYDLPYLYPPYALPLFAPFTAIPRDLLLWAWFFASLAMAAWSCRALGIPARWIPPVLAWAPFAEGLVNGNIQIAIFAGFVLILIRGVAGETPSRPARRSILATGLVAAGTAFLKVSQPHLIAFLARWDRRSAIVAVLAITAIALATLSVTGVDLWREWLDQLRRAADPSWTVGGPTLARYLPPPLSTLVVLGCLAAVLVVPRASAPVWVGVLMVIGAPSLHTYYLLFLLPAMLRIRLEISLVAATLIALYTEPSWWLAIVLIVGTLVLAQRWSEFLEPLPIQPGRPARVSASASRAGAGRSRRPRS